MLRLQREPDEQAVRFNSFMLDVPARSLVHGVDAVALTPKELDVLVALVRLRARWFPPLPCSAVRCDWIRSSFRHMWGWRVSQCACSGPAVRRRVRDSQ